MTLGEFLRNEPPGGSLNWYLACPEGAMVVHFNRRTGELTIRLTAVNI